MSTPPHDESASNPQSYSVAKDNSPTPSEVITAFKNWLLRRSETPREKSKWTDIALVILTFLVAVAAFVSACIFQGQLTEARRATNLTSESFRIDERAWVEIEPIKPTLFSPRADKIGAAFTYEIYLKNVGKTPARDIEFRSTPLTQGSITLGSSAQWANGIQEKQLLGKVPTASDIPINNPVSKVLAPNTTATIPFTVHGQEPQYLSKDEWVSYLLGRVDYTDAFGVKHWLKFCFFVADARGNLWNCKEGNDEDRNPENPSPKPN